MRMTYAEPFSTAAITASLAKLRIDQGTIERSIKRTVADIMARQLLDAKRQVSLRIGRVVGFSAKRVHVEMICAGTERTIAIHPSFIVETF